MKATLHARMLVAVAGAAVCTVTAGAAQDRCHKSFVVYDGSWTMTPQSSGTDLIYELTAKPAFNVPGMVLRRLLDRDAREMIDGLRAEIALRADSR